MKTVVCLWHNLGDYHIKRLNLIREAYQDCRVVGVQVARYSTRYGWVHDCDELRKHEIISVFPNEYDDESCIEKLLCWVKLWKKLSELGPSTIYVSGWGFFYSIVAIAWTWVAGAQSIVFAESGYQSVRDGILKKLIKRFVIKKSLIFAGASTHGLYVHSHLGVPADRIVTGYLIVDNEALIKNSKKNSDVINESYGRFFLCVGRFVERKNYKALIRGYAEYLLASDSDVNLVVVGDGDLRKEYQELATSLQIIDRVFFPGWVQFDELGHFFGSCVAFVHPAFFEEWGLVINEAMAAGVPVIVDRRVGAAPELVNADTGILINSDCLPEICAALHEMDNLSPIRRSKIAAASRALIESKYSARSFLNNIREIKSRSAVVSTTPRVVDSVIIRFLLALMLFR